VRLKNPTMQPAGDVVELWESACHLLVHNAYGPLRPWARPEARSQPAQAPTAEHPAWRRSPKRVPLDWARLIRKLARATTRPPPMALAPAISAVATALDMELHGTAASGCRRPIESAATVTRIGSGSVRDRQRVGRRHRPVAIAVARPPGERTRMRSSHEAARLDLGHAFRRLRTPS
jgi:hypothetical protein